MRELLYPIPAHPKSRSIRLLDSQCHDMSNSERSVSFSIPSSCFIPPGGVLVLDVPKIKQIEWDIPCVLGEQNDGFAQRQAPVQLLSINRIVALAKPQISTRTDEG